MSAQNCPRCGGRVMRLGIDEFRRDELGCIACGWRDEAPISPLVVAVLSKEADRSNRSGYGR